MYRIIPHHRCCFFSWLPEPGPRRLLDFKQINTESYRLYLAQEWDSLISLGKHALKQDVDFYYLRMRMGIARYDQKKYRQAGIHFRKALEFNQDDPVALEYLYYAYLFSGQIEQAKLLRKEFRGDLALKLTAPERKSSWTTLAVNSFTARP